LVIYWFPLGAIFNLIFCADDEFEVATKGQETHNSTTNKTEVQSSLKEKEDLVHITSNTEDKEYYNFKIKKLLRPFFILILRIKIRIGLIDNVWEKGTDIIMSGVKDLGPNLGIGAAVGKIGSEIIKHTAGMAPAPRIAMVGTTALATAAGTKIVIESLRSKALIDIKKREHEIDVNKLETIDISGRNSPTDFDGGFIHSVLDKNEIEIPLLTMVNGLCYLIYIEFILILSLFSLLFRKFFFSKLIGFILTFKIKWVLRKGSLTFIKNKNNNKIKNRNRSPQKLRSRTFPSTTMGEGGE
jgi:hypothetical protein